MKGQYKFDSKVWKNRSEEGKDFISALLQVEPAKRPTAQEAFRHPWLSKKTILSHRKPDPDVLNSAQANLIRYADSGEFKKVVMNVIAKKSTTEDILELRKVFEEYDADKDGTISFSEFKKALARSNYTDKESETMFRKMVGVHNFLFAATCPSIMSVVLTLFLLGCKPERSHHVH
jgi:calcium-dependent protein kinase